MSPRKPASSNHRSAKQQVPEARNATVFPGKPYQQNLAVQRSLMEIFDEFTEVISEELKSMNLEEFENANRPKS